MERQSEERRGLPTCEGKPRSIFIGEAMLGTLVGCALIVASPFIYSSEAANTVSALAMIWFADRALVV